MASCWLLDWSKFGTVVGLLSAVFLLRLVYYVALCCVFVLVLGVVVLGV